MGCGIVFGRCVAGEALHDAEVVSPLVGLDDGVSLVFLGNENEKGALSGQIVRVDSEELTAYQGDNVINPNQYSGLDLADVRVAALEQARPVMLRGMGIGESESAPDAFRGGPMTVDGANQVFEEYGISFVKSAVSRAAQRANDLRDVEEDKFDDDGQITDYEQAILGTYEAAALAAGGVLDRLNMVDNLPDIAPILIEAINAHDDITPEQKSFLVADITMGGQDAGFQVSEPAVGMEFK